MRERWWHGEWLVGALLVAALAMTLRYDPLAGVEGWGYDLAFRLAESGHLDNGVVIVATDGTSWSQEEASRLLERLGQAAPRAAALFWPVDKAFYPRDVVALGAEAEQLLVQTPLSDATPLLQRMADVFTSEQRLATAMRGIEHLLFAPPSAASWSLRWRWSIDELWSPQPPQATTALAASPLFAGGTLAYDTAMRDPSGVERRLPLLYRKLDGTLAPTLPLQLLLASLPGAPRALRYGEGNRLALGNTVISSDSGGYFYPRWSRDRVRRVALAALLAGDAEAVDALRQRVVLVGPLSPAAGSMVTLPDGRQVAPAESVALALSALTADAALTLPPYARWAQLGTLLLVMLVLTLLLPRLSSGVALVTGTVLFVLLLNAQLLLFLLRAEWLPLVTPLLALGLGMLLLMARRRLVRGVEHVRQQLATVTVALARQLRQQGQFDDAFYHLQQCPVDAACDELYQLGLDYERKRQFNRAEQVFTHIHGERPRFKDVAERVRINREASERIAVPGHASGAMASTLVLDQSALQKPVVGRYRIERELGRGAMGMVYLGHDPKISRTVAIKAVMLAHNQDEKQLGQVRERFFREAESAGRLSHPNIVTIYDVGEEGDLAYIAMDYLEGGSLEHYTGKEELLPVEEVMAIIAQVADALDYAHGKGVVHRDIKPANIIYDRAQRLATVTDFGVAHLADASKTRTGTILGSPYYMAPEQLAGGRIDGRADLFSLGVTFYQLLTGELPFQADSIATLMYKITHSRQVSVSKLRRGVPSCATRIVNQLLNKDVEKRFQSGQELQKSLRRCLQ